MKYRYIRALLLLLLVCALLCACGKSKEESGPEPTAVPTIAAATPAGQPTVTVPPTKTPTPTEEIAITPTDRPDPTPTEVLPKAVSFEIVEKTFNSPLGEYNGGELLDKLTLTYRMEADSTEETFDSEAFAKRDGEVFAKNAEALRTEMAAEFKGKMLLRTKRLAAINLNDAGILEIYEHAAYGYAGIGCMEKPKEWAAPKVFYYRVEYQLHVIEPRHEYESRYYGIIREELKPEDNAGYRSYAGDFEPYYADGALQAIRATLSADKVLTADNNSFGYEGTLKNVGKAFFKTDGTPVVFLETTSLSTVSWDSFAREKPLGAYIFTPGNQILFSEAADDWQIMAFRASDFQKSFRMLAEGVSEAVMYPVKHFQQKVDDDHYRYRDEYDLGDGFLLETTVSNSYNSTLTVDWRVRYEEVEYGYSLYDSLMPFGETKTDAAGNKLTMTSLSAEGYNTDQVRLVLSERNANDEPVAEFDSDLYLAALRTEFAGNARTYENELKAAYRGQALLREKVIESVAFPGFGRVDVCEVAAYGAIPDVAGGDRVFSYLVKCRFFDTEGKAYRDCRILEICGGKNNADYYELIKFDELSSLGDPLTAVTIHRYLYGDPSEMYNDTAYDSVTWFDAEGNPLLYGEDSWGEATDYYWVPGNIAIRGVDGTEYFSKKDGKVFDYTLAELDTAFRYAAEEYSKLTAMETRLPKDKIQWRKSEYSELQFFFKDSRKPSDELEIVFDATWYYNTETKDGVFFYTYVLSLLYHGEEIPFAEYRFYSPY